MRTLQAKIPTKEEGVFYKQIINDDNKEVDKVYVIRYREFGRDKLKTIGKYSQGIRLAQCKKIRNETLIRLAHGENLPKITQAKQTIGFGELAEAYWKSKQASRSYAGEKERYDANLSHLDKLQAVQITREYVEELQQQFAGKFAAATVNNLIMRIGSIFKYAIDIGLYKGNNPCSAIKRLKVSNERERYLNALEVQELKEALADDFELSLFVEIALTTGARLGTIMGIKRGDIDFEAGIINLTNFKTTAKYTGFITPTLRLMLEKQVKGKKSKDLLLNIPRTTVSYKLRKIMHELFNDEDTLDKDKAVIHTLRHTFASHLAINGTPIYTIQRLMNHKTIEMTMRYAKLAPDSGRNFVNGLYQ